MSNNVDEQAARVLNPEDEVRPFWSVPWEFAVHALVGTLIFAIIAGAATLLDLILHRLETIGISGAIIFGLKLGEYALLLADLILFGTFLWRTVSRTSKHL